MTTEQLHQISIQGLPEGWRAVAFRVPIQGESIIDYSGTLRVVQGYYEQPRLIVEKIKPRRIVLEETEKDNFKYTNGFYANQVLGNGIHIVDQPRIWRVVDGNEATFRDRVREDLIKNKVIVKEGE